METEALERYLNSFGQQVVNRAKGNLQKSKGGGTALEKSIKFNVIKTAEGFAVQFLMTDYGPFVDKGVSGTEAKRKFKDYKGKVKSTPYSYKNRKGHSQPPSSALDKWIVKKGIAPRDKEGRFLSRKSISFLIARSIGKKGIKGLSFFQKPLGLGLKQFGKEMLGAISEDILKSINSTTTVK